MKVNGAHLSYCTNIHPGESWDDTFSAIQTYTPRVKELLKAEKFGIGLRLSNEAIFGWNETRLDNFKHWLQQEGMYVFTINGFPYGDFHHVRVKDRVHHPDWLSRERVDYTVRLVNILAKLLPADSDGGISTSPVSYRFWHRDINQAMQDAIAHFMQVTDTMIRMEKETGKYIHIDIEPEPDGILENSSEFIHFYNDFLLKLGVPILQKMGWENAEEKIRRHVQCCYDVCHFAVEFEEGGEVIDQLEAEGIGIGKMQISAALRASLDRGPASVYDALEEFEEDTYLHQAVGKKGDQLYKYRDLDELLRERPELDEVRSHFHVPIFINEYGLLHSTQDAIRKVLSKWSEKPFSRHLEVETYTWNVLPPDLVEQLPVSIARELAWVMNEIA